MLIKGSEVGFPLAKIVRVVNLKHEISQKEELLNTKEKLWQIEQKNQRPSLTPTHRLFKKIKERDQEDERSELREVVQLLKEICTGIIDELLKPEYTGQSIDPNWLQEYKKRKRKKYDTHKGCDMRQLKNHSTIKLSYSDRNKCG